MNELVRDNGGNRLCDLGLADAADSDMFTQFDSWGETAFWPAVVATFGGVPQQTVKAKSSLQVEVSSGVRASTLGLQLEEGFVVENKLLTKTGVPTKRLLRFKLPSDMTYQCGDYLAVLPVNPSTVVRRAIRRFDLPWDAILRVQKPSSGSAPPSIPLDTPISAFELLSTYVELSQPASKRDVKLLADAAIEDAEVQAELHYIASSPSRFTTEIVQKRISPLDILMRSQNVEFYSPANELPHRIDAPSDWPAEAVIHTDNPDRLLPAELLTPHLDIFRRPQAKELLITPKGLRLVYQASQADKLHYQVLRQASFELPTLPPELLQELMDRLIALERSIQQAQALRDRERQPRPQPDH